MRIFRSLIFISFIFITTTLFAQEIPFQHYPDWQSDDIDYHGHLAVGDVNKDGWPDVAVSVYIGPGGFSDPGKVKVYYNQGGELEGTPSFESYEFYTFSCAFGDMDQNGFLDVVFSCEETPNYIFLANNEGAISDADG